MLVLVTCCDLFSSVRTQYITALDCLAHIQSTFCPHAFRYACLVRGRPIRLPAIRPPCPQRVQHSGLCMFGLSVRDAGLRSIHLSSFCHDAKNLVFRATFAFLEMAVPAVLHEVDFPSSKTSHPGCQQRTTSTKHASIYTMVMSRSCYEHA